MKRVITEQHYLNKYVNKVKTQREKDKDSWVSKLATIPFDYFAVIRPTKTKLTGLTISRFMNNWIYRYDRFNLDDISLVYYTLEKDFEKNWYHANILIKGQKVTRRKLATSMKRTIDEVGYLEKIKDVKSSAIYVNKYSGLKQLADGRGLVDVNHLIDERLFKDEKWELDKNKKPIITGSYKIFDNHPNREYHFRAKFVSKVLHGWMDNNKF